MQDEFVVLHGRHQPAGKVLLDFRFGVHGRTLFGICFYVFHSMLLGWQRVPRSRGPWRAQHSTAAPEAKLMMWHGKVGDGVERRVEVPGFPPARE